MEMLSMKTHSFIYWFIKFWHLHTDTNENMKHDMSPNSI